jgi:hypothetical protein
VAKEKCDDFSGNSKDVCQKDAKAAHVKALESAKVSKFEMIRLQSQVILPTQERTPARKPGSGLQGCQRAL